MDSSNPFYNRTTSAFPVSIGTALAMESILEGVKPAYDPDRQKPERVKLFDYQALWINVETLIRNIMGSIPTEAHPRVGIADVYEVLVQEMTSIVEYVSAQSNESVEVVYYINRKKDLAQAHRNAKLRVASTSKQMFYEALTKSVIKAVTKELGSESFFMTDRLLMPPGKPKALFITHQAYDLLSSPYFDKLDLLESHTGVLKKRSLWYTKLNGSKDLARMPFNTCTLQVFGDSNTFAPFPIAVREQLIELADRYQWHALTTKDRVVFGLNSMKDVFTASILKSMLSEH